MKILVLAPHPFYLERSAPIQTKILLEELVRAGHQPTVIVYGEGDEITIPGCTVVRLKRSLFFNVSQRGFSRKRLFKFLAMYRRALKLLKNEEFDLVHAIEEGIFIAHRLRKKLGVPYISHINTDLSAELCANNSTITKFLPRLKKLEQAAVKESLGVLVSCRYLENKVLSFDYTEPLQIIEGITLIDKHTPVERNKSNTLKLPKNCVTFLYAGNLDQYQDFDLLLEGFSLACLENDFIQLAIIGGTPADIRKYKRAASRLGIPKNQIQFTGTKPLKELSLFFEQADVLVSPRCSGQTVPLKLYSYLDSGKPVLATRTQPHTQIVNDSHALLVEPNGTDLAAGITKLAENGKLRGQFTKESTFLVQEKFTRKTFSQKLNAFYLKIAEKATQDS